MPFPFSNTGGQIINKVTFTPDWQDWITTNVNNGQDKNGIFKILLDEGYAYDAIARQMAFEPTMPLEQLVNPFHAAQQQHEYQPQNPNQNNHSEQKPQIANAIDLSDERIEMYLLKDFLTPQECQQIIDRIRSKLRPSTLTSSESDNQYRTSRTCDLGTLNDPFIEDIDNRLCRTIGIDASYSEVLQGQFYQPGQQFKAHTDYFESYELDQYGGAMGQRTYTMMIYLNDVEAGGQTQFPRVGQCFTPEAGTVVIWNSLKADGSTNLDTLHTALPVLAGYKAVITKWFRSHSRLPQPPPMWSKGANERLPNLTATGFHKARLPENLFQQLQAYYHSHTAAAADEHVPGNFIINSDGQHQSSQMVELDQALRVQVHQTLQPMLQDWCGIPLQPTYVYGIRVYLQGAILKPHRDRQKTHIVSAIINVDQQAQTDWPLMIEDHHYRQHQILLKPGEVLFYEGARLLHGRPQPFEGEHYANVFCHFIPLQQNTAY